MAKRRTGGMTGALAGTSPMIGRRVETDPNLEITRMVRNANGILEAKKAAIIMDSVLNGNGNAQPVQNETTREILSMAQGVAALQQGAAQTAISLADIERKRRMEAEQEASGQAEYARQDEQQKANTTLEIVRQMAAMQQQQMENTYKMQLELTNAQSATQLAAINERIAAMDKQNELQRQLMEERYKTQLEREHEERVRAQQQAEALSRPKSFLEHQADLAAAAWREGRAADAIGIFGGTRGQTPQEKLDELHVELYKQEKIAEIQGKQEERQMRQDFIQEGIAALQNIVPGLAASLGNPVGAPVRNGLGAEPPGFEPPAGAPVPTVPQTPPMGGGAAAEIDFGSEGL